MLTHVSIENYRCFPKLDVELKPLTVLIGANNTGKSAFIDAIRVLTGQIGAIGQMDFWRLDSTNEVSIRGTTSSEGESTVSSKEASRRESRKHAHESKKPLSGVEFFRLPVRGISCRCEGINEATKELPLKEEGNNLAAVLDYLLRKDRHRFDGVVATLGELIPGFEDLLIDTPDAKSRQIRVRLDDALELPGEALSVGVRHLIFFVTLAYHPRAPKIILVEEPEVGVHPKRLGDIVRLLRSISQGVHCSHAAQVILTTHSPYLLDHVNLDTDQLLIFQREKDPNGARNAYPADKVRLANFLDEFMLGEVWFNETEAGLVGKPSP